jgi:HEAT repeat protein
MKNVLLPIGIALAGAAGGVALLLVAGPDRNATSPPAVPQPVPAGPAAPPVRASTYPAGGSGLLSQDEAERRKAVSSLQTRPDAAAIPHLFKMLEHEAHPGVRNLIYAALAKCGDESLVPELLQRFRSEEDFRNRHAALEAAVDIGGPVVTALCEKLLRIPDVAREDVLILDLAARALAESEDPKYLPELETFVTEAHDDLDTDTNRSARIASIEALANAGGDKRAAALERIASNPKQEETLREEAISNLGLMEGREGFDALKRLLEKFLPLGDPEEDMFDVREYVLRALGGRAEPESLDLLLPIATGKAGVNDSIRREAISALGDKGYDRRSEKLDTKDLVDVFLAIASDPAASVGVRGEAWTALARTAEPAVACPVLRDAVLAGATTEERQVALRSLGHVAREARKPYLLEVVAATTDDKVRSLATLLAN